MIYKIIRPHGKPRDFCAAACSEYLKRLRRYCDIQTQPPLNDVFERDPKTKWIGIIPGGKNFSSEDMAEWIKTINLGTVEHNDDILEESNHNKPISQVYFFIDQEDLSARYDYTMSLSPIKLSWDLHEVILLEQIYRAYRIINDEMYHK